MPKYTEAFFNIAHKPVTIMQIRNEYNLDHTVYERRYKVYYFSKSHQQRMPTSSGGQPLSVGVEITGPPHSHPPLPLGLFSVLPLSPPLG